MPSTMNTQYNPGGIQVDTNAPGASFDQLGGAGMQLGALSNYANQMMAYKAKMLADQRAQDQANKDREFQLRRQDQRFQQQAAKDQLMQAEAMRHAQESAPAQPVQDPNYGPTPASYGRFQMNHTGNWGTFVDPANIPADLQSKIMGGFHGQAGNWDTSNPSITGPQQWNTGKYTKNASGAGSGGPQASMATIGDGGEGTAEERLAIARAKSGRG